MSTIKMCDFCGRTSRSDKEMKQFSFSSSLLPDHLRTAGTSPNTTVNVDACTLCQEAIAEALDGVITARAGSAPEGVAG